VAPLTLAHPNALEPSSLELLERLRSLTALDDMYLAGSAALALYLDHRPVSSLDWMSATCRLQPPDRRDLLQDLLALDPDARVETARDGFLFVRSGAGVGLKFFYYPYPLIDPEEELDGLWVASALDLALMKLGAIISRGTRRDFVDFYLLSRKLDLDEILDRSGEKFGHVLDFPLQALKGLVDFSLIEGEPLPRLNSALDWAGVRTTLESEARCAALNRLGTDPTQETQ